MNLQPHHAVAAPLAVTGVGLVAIALLAIGGWPGLVGSSGMNFCEQGSGIIRQPANTWSNLAYVVAGVIAGARARRHFRDRNPQPGGNRIRSRLLYPVLYAGIAASIGPASMALHASTTTWGGKVDILSMFLWATFVLAYGMARILAWDERRFLAAFAAIFLAAATVYLTQPIAVTGTAIFGVMVALVALAEGWVLLRRREWTADRHYLWLALAAFVVAFAVWLPSQTGGPLCDPHSLLQGHALWHVLTASSVLCLYLYFESERAAVPNPRWADA